MNREFLHRPAGSGTPSHAACPVLSILLAALLGAGLLATVLAGTASDAFELDRFSVPKELVLHVTALLAVVICAFRWRRIRLTVPELMLIAFVCWSGVSALLATNRWIGLRSFVLSTSGLLIFFAARRIARDRPEPRYARARADTGGDRGFEAAAAPTRTDAPARSILLGLLGLAAIVGAASGVVQAWGFDLPAIAEQRAPGGTFGNRNFLAHFTVIGLPVLALLVVRARPGTARFGWLIGLALCGNAVVLTRSRAAWLGLAAAAAASAVALLIARRTVLPTRRDLLAPTAVTAALALGALSAVVIPNTLEWRSDSPYAETLSRLTEYRGGSGRGRLIQYGNSLSLVARNPVFGTGPGNWFIEYPLVTTPGDPSFAGADPIPTNPWPSSDWVALLAERGVPGFGMVLLAGAAILLAAVRRLFLQDPDDALEAATLVAVLAATTVTGMFDAVLLNPAPTFLVAAAVGALLPDSKPIVDRPAPMRQRAAIVALTLALTLGAAARSAQQLIAIRIVERGNASTSAMRRALVVDPPNHRLHLRLATRGSCRDRLPHARAAVRLMPFHTAPERALAACR